jgi:hypothetical protein
MQNEHHSFQKENAEYSCLLGDVSNALDLCTETDIWSRCGLLVCRQSPNKEVAILMQGRRAKERLSIGHSSISISGALCGYANHPFSAHGFVSQYIAAAGVFRRSIVGAVMGHCQSRLRVKKERCLQM